MEIGKLYLTPSPIGNLEDISLRTLNILKSVDIIAAEDTRRTQKLLNHYDIKNKLTSYHQHNEREKGEKLISELVNGKNIAIITDGGSPGISDPGEIIVKLAIENNIQIIPIPGATAFVPAVTISGLDSNRFTFYGFLAHKRVDKKRELENLAQHPFTLIFYESPHRLKETLELILEVFGDREISLSKELTKVYEDTQRGKISHILNNLEEIKGEYVIIVEKAEIIEEELTDSDIIKEIENLMSLGVKKSKAVKGVSDKLDIARNRVYKLSLNIRS